MSNIPDQAMLHEPSGTQVSLATIQRIHMLAAMATCIPENMLTPPSGLTTAKEYALIQRAMSERRFQEWKNKHE